MISRLENIWFIILVFCIELKLKNNIIIVKLVVKWIKYLENIIWWYNEKKSKKFI